MGAEARDKGTMTRTTVRLNPPRNPSTLKLKYFQTILTLCLFQMKNKLHNCQNMRQRRTSATLLAKVVKESISVVPVPPWRDLPWRHRQRKAKIHNIHGANDDVVISEDTSTSLTTSSTSPALPKTSDTWRWSGHVLGRTYESINHTEQDSTSADQDVRRPRRPPPKTSPTETLAAQDITVQDSHRQTLATETSTAQTLAGETSAA